MIFEIYPAGVFQTNCYIIGDESTREGAVIDPGGDADTILKICSKHNLNVKYIILTHGHGDHIGGVYAIKEKTNAKILLNIKDEYLVKGTTKTLIPILGKIRLFEVDEFVTDGQMIRLGSLEIHVMETPGHTPGSISLWVNDFVFTGDALFQGSIGRTDFEFGDHSQLINSIKTKLFNLPDSTKVHPGHGASTTVGNEKRYNPFFI